MSGIISNATTFLSHYLSYKNVASDFPTLAKLSLTGALTLSTPYAGDVATQTALMGANKKVFVLVDSITDIANEMTIYMKDGVTTANNKGVVFVPITAGGTGYTTSPTITWTAATWTTPPTYNVIIVGGVILGVVITNPGVASVVPTGATFTGGSGSGATIGTLVLGVASATVEAHSGIDAIYPFVTGATNGFDITAPTGSIVYGVGNGTANVALVVLSVDDTTWSDLGQNFNEGVQFTKGVMATPVSRGWNATDHSVRVRATCQFSIRQLYSSMLEGIANLRGKTILIKDEVRPDGGSLAKETHYITGCQFENCALEVGGGGGNGGVDSVTGSGYFRRMYTWTLDSNILNSALI